MSQSLSQFVVASALRGAAAGLREVRREPDYESCAVCGTRDVLPGLVDDIYGEAYCSEAHHDEAVSNRA